jgi:hypothetical protein
VHRNQIGKLELADHVEHAQLRHRHWVLHPEQYAQPGPSR